jgi:hypothetical protein
MTVHSGGKKPTNISQKTKNTPKNNRRDEIIDFQSSRLKNLSKINTIIQNVRVIITFISISINFHAKSIESLNIKEYINQN